MLSVKTCATLDEAARALTSERGARYLGGGTLVMRAVNEGDVGIETLVRATDPESRTIRATGGRVQLGAGVTMAQVLRSPDLAFLHPVARAVGGPALRTMATVGGNLFAPSPYGDFATALLALDATVALGGGYGGREQPLAELLSSRGRGAGGLVQAVTFERPAGETFRFRKAARVKPKGIAVITIAATLPLSGGQVTGARIAYGAMAPTPIRVPAVERALEGRTLDAAGIAPALAVAVEGTSPATDAIASAWYRLEVAPVHLRRLLLGEGA
jgi:CO/xanthine dehydrogenase FAD-binding subunit